MATELRKVASTLLGTADGLEDPSELPAAFRSMTEAAMGKSVADVSLRVWTPAGSKIRFVKQVFPQVEELTGRKVEVSARIGDYPTGAWGAESRDYHISVEVEPDTIGEEVLAARFSLVSGGSVLTEKLVLARWTDDTALSTKINPQVAHYTGQAELASVIQEGSRPATRVTRRRRRPSWGARSSSPTSPATRVRPSCWPASWTWWTRRPAPCA
ncbi:hypothetical protein ACFQ1L_02390 [Phytohabitans flavus]|uniref:hypothetical protein n=1 Tax=Phytohabitans flavus TaxID=1076124 RepID=UPI00363BD4DB